MTNLNLTMEVATTNREEIMVGTTRPLAFDCLMITPTSGSPRPARIIMNW